MRRCMAKLPAFSAGLALLACLWLGFPAGAAAQPDAGKPDAGKAIATRGQVRTITKDSAGRSLIVLKVVTGAKLPFTSITFVVRDPSLLSGIAVGDEVFFTAARVDGDNTVRTLRKTTPCVRFQTCEQHGEP